MTSRYFLLAALCIIAAACAKKNDPPPPAPPDNKETVTVRFRLTGDILTLDTNLPFERRAGQTDWYARALRDSTIFAVMVEKADAPWPRLYSSGMFSRADSVVLDLPVEQKVNIIVRAFRKGSGGGIFYTWKNGLPYFDAPFKATLNNRMDTLQRAMTDTVSWVRVTDPADSTKSFGEKVHPELDFFHGSTTLTVMPSPVSQTLSLKRMSFGVKLSSPNFTTGKLLLELQGSHPQSVTPADINTRYFVFGSDLFKFTQQFTGRVAIKWQKPNGAIVSLGEKDIVFKRNVLTKIEVKISEDGRVNLDPVITETDWSGTETVVF